MNVTGNKAISDLTRDDMLDFVDWWQDRIERDDLTPNSANKDLTDIASMLRRLNEKKRLGLDVENLVGRLRIAEGEKRHRPPFSTSWIRDKLLAPGALDGLNGQARAILIGMINTGYRPSEAASLSPEHIILNAEIPHIVIAPEGRQLKSQYSRRSIPLTGVSLEAFREHPGGFPRYADNPALSATVNKFLKENGLQETPDHTFYCLRHSFEDRLLGAEVDERIRRDLMGHTLNRQRYVHGASLSHTQKILMRIAI
ncbi:tyrosine-type recombinase/integrase [Maritimibacter sp. DP1N21-5]|uniref:tyrosine-type recombinase/integrase n=1 Tax=Maritimibacter sp. DP1N21-5 TaxID=2836867 RepID=UPI00351D7239